jgi:hypothetical protein
VGNLSCVCRTRRLEGFREHVRGLRTANPHFVKLFETTQSLSGPNERRIRVVFARDVADL